MTINFDTHDYFNSHLQAPRGRGGWMFALDLDEARRGEYRNVLSSPSMTYADAKRWARAEVTARIFAGRLPQEVTLYVLA
jgi:hypothetical protein